MQATLTHNTHDGKIKQHRKEASFCAEYAAITPDNKTPIIARLYTTKSRDYGYTFHACVWINAQAVHVSGGGKAGGCGYHKASAALDAALSDAGVKLSESISGRGDSAMIEALQAVAQAIGCPQVYIHHSHA